MGGGKYIQPGHVKQEKIDEEDWIQLIQEAKCSNPHVALLRYDHCSCQ